MYPGSIVECWLCGREFIESEIEIVGKNSYCTECAKNMRQSKAKSAHENGNKMSEVYNRKIEALCNMMKDAKGGQRLTTTAQARLLSEYITSLTIFGALLDVVEGRCNAEEKEMVVKQARHFWKN